MSKNEIKYDLGLVKQVKEELQDIDKTNILGERLDFLSNVLSIVKGQGYKFSDIKLIEGGSCVGRSCGEHWKPSVAYFFANYPDFMEHMGYDSRVGKENTGIMPAIAENKSNFVLDSEEVFENVVSQNIGMDFWDLVRETYTDKKLVICSNYVLGVADEYAPFWNLPGLHIHQFASGDFEEGSILSDGGRHKDIFETYAKHHPTLESKIKKIYGINYDAKIFRNVAGNFEEAIIVYDND